MFAMDGADISDPGNGRRDVLNFNVDAVEEIKSSSGWMPAEESASGPRDLQILVTRSGASGFHGSVFEFVRNSAFDARNYSSTMRRRTSGRFRPSRNEFGFTNGGAVILPHVYDGRGENFYFGAISGIPAGTGNNAGDSCSDRGAAAIGGQREYRGQPDGIQQPDGS